MLKVFLVEDESIMREGLRDNMPWQQYGYDFVGEASDGEMALPLIRKTRPDVLITDIKMPFMSGIEFAEAIRKYGLQTEIVVITGYAEFEYVHKLLHLGVYGYLLKPLDKEELKSCMCRLKDKILHNQELEALVRQDKGSSEAGEGNYLMPDEDKMLLGELLIEGKAVEVLALIENYHSELCMRRISSNQMKQNYTYLFNSIYRALLKKGLVDDEVKSCMLTLFEERFSELEDARETFDFIRGLLEQLLGSLHHTENEEENLHLQKSLDYIDKHFASNISMAEVANYIGVSYGYLSYILNKNIYGGFVRALRNRRLKEAKKLLVSSEFKIYDIAEQCGFTNSRYFCTMFYADEGMTPTEYRKKHFRVHNR